MGDILVIAREEDACSRLVRERLLARGREVVFLEEGALFPGVNFSWEMAAGNSRGRVGSNGTTVAFSDIDAVLARFYGITASAQDFQTPDGQYLCSEWNGMARGFLEALPCLVINRPRPELWYKTRLTTADLLALVPGIKFSLPLTMVTTRIEDARAFYRACGGRIRYSPLTAASNYPIETEEQLDKLEKLARLTPLFLSEVVPGRSVDAYLVGEEVVFDPPVGEAADVAEHCRRIGRQSGLAFCRFELRKSAADDWYCLGLDGMPYLYDCREEVRDAIADRLADALAGAKGGAA